MSSGIWEACVLVVTGPSGNVGVELVELLQQRTVGQPWRVASRHPEQLAERLGESGETARLDFFDRSTWAAALDGVQTLFLLFPLPGNKAARSAILPFLDAAERAGCRHVVYVSVFGAERAKFIPHYKIEQHLFASSMTWTVLRCSFFMQNLHRHISTHGTDMTERGELFIPAGKGRTTFIDARDAAAVAADALLHPAAHHNRVHHLTGSEALTMEQVAATLTRHLARPVRYTRPGLLRFAARLRRRNVGWDTIGFMSAVYTLTRLGQNQPVSDEVAQLLGRPPCTLDRYVEHSAWRWQQQAWS
ncbi:NmrA family NAD(P)-binding protein [Streptomyces purpurogeneiscleroticus]|uniref:NmrA family NAD(P)-binding protein n=1 Tax=Streptomyces purpurogeneiscleroticus TaxID=68259 RepID=UPI001CBE5362|nr:NmrA family NAD(P)-binding protein [Streptomyces purpurogeneiscleroticus]